MRALLDIVAPIRCLSCGADSDGELCAACAEHVRLLSPPMCARCGTPTRVPAAGCGQCRDLDGFTRARSLVVFAEPARRLTLAFKRRGRRPLARSMGDLLAELAGRTGLTADVVTFVPAGRRARRAGFDHAQLLAGAVARSLGLPARPLLDRVGDGPRQSDVSFAERRRNVRHRFSARPAGGRILLVDDVFTTGATAESCSLALRVAGAGSVDVLTWARTLRRAPMPM